VQEAYVSFNLQQRQTEAPRGRQVSSVRAGQCSGGSRNGDHGRGCGRGDRSKGIFSAEELATCKVVNRDYSTKEYKKLTPLQKQKLYQLHNPDKQLGTGPTRQSRRGGHNDSASIASTNTSGMKCNKDDSRRDTEGENDQNQNSWGRNRDMSPVAGRQRTGSAKAQKMDKKDE
jgi:hypothetical protein